MHGKVLGLTRPVLWNRWARGRGYRSYLSRILRRATFMTARMSPIAALNSFINFMKWFRPRYMLHGHVHTWDRRKTVRTQFESTCVLNINPFTVLELDPALMGLTATTAAD